MGLTYDVLIGDFYDRLGYRTVGVLEDCPAGNATRWYCKDLNWVARSPVRHEFSSPGRRALISCYVRSRSSQVSPSGTPGTRRR